MQFSLLQERVEGVLVPVCNLTLVHQQEEIIKVVMDNIRGLFDLSFSLPPVFQDTS